MGEVPSGNAAESRIDIEPYWTRNFIDKNVREVASVVSKFYIDPDSVRKLKGSDNLRMTDKRIAESLGKIDVFDQYFKNIDLSTDEGVTKAVTLTSAKNLALIESSDKFKSSFRKFEDKLISNFVDFASGIDRKRVVALAMLIPVLSAACSPQLAPQTPETSNQSAQAVEREGTFYVEWQADTQKSTKDYFKLAESPYQKWENIASQGTDYIYTFHFAAQLELDKNTNKVILNTEVPTPEAFTFYENPQIKTKYLENPAGIMLKTNVDPVYLINALHEFSGSQKIELLLTEMSVLPSSKFDKSIPRYVDNNVVGIENLRLISLGPLLPATSSPQPENSPDFNDVSKKESGFWQTPVYILRVTNQDGSQSYYKAVPIKIDGANQSG